jgi:cytidine deaminase
MKTIELKIHISEFESLHDLSVDDRQLVESSRLASNDAWAHYSKFKVGAALLLSNGEIITANNQENAAFPSGLCAERIAMFYANAKYPDTRVVAVAVSAQFKGDFVDLPVTPCGACRQVMLETEKRFSSPIKVIMAGERQIMISDSVANLIPFAFDGKLLET